MAQRLFSQNKTGFKVLLGVLLSTGALLPLVVATSANDNPLRLLSKADVNQHVRVWIEPAAVVTAVGQPVSLAIMAEYPRPDAFLSTFSLALHADEGVRLSQTTFTYDGGFRGKVKVGEVTITPQTTGKKSLWIDENSIQSGMPNLVLEAPGKATVIVQ